MTTRFTVLRVRVHAFSLIEVLAVLGILTVLVAGAAPSILSTVKASRLTSAASQVTGKLNEAHGMAVTFSNDFEVRLLAPDADEPNSRDRLQLFALVDADTADVTEETFTAVGTPEPLPDAIVFSRNERLSSLLKKSGEENKRAVLGVIRFHPDGSTSLPESGSWHLTLVESDHQDASDLPANFATIQIDPVTGRLEVYRPE